MYNSKGQHIGGLFQFYTTMRKLIREFSVGKVVVFWDGPMSGKLRYDLYPEYKAQRTNKFTLGYKEPEEPEFEYQRGRIKEYAEELFIRQFECEVCEADDLIAWYCLNKPETEEVIILSSDADLCQLLSETVTMYVLNKKKIVNIGTYGFEYGHHYQNAGLIKMITGCSSDNVKGVEGVKEKTLLKYFPEIAKRKVELKEILEEAENQQSSRKKRLKTLDNLIYGKSKSKQQGNLFFINEKITNLVQPLLTDEAKEEVEALIDSVIDPEDRGHKNVLRMMMDDEFMTKNHDWYIDFLRPFIKLIKVEQAKFKTENQKQKT